MMKIAIRVLALVALVSAYADVDDKIHFEDIIKKPDELKHQLYCYLDRGPCTDMEETHKHHIREAVLTACAKCTPTHKHNVKVFYHGIKELFPDLYHEFRQKYDPDGKHYDLAIDEVEKF